jgi:hypothetical protein
MMMRAYKRLRSESGASAVEFALLLPVLMLILFGIIEFGLALHRQAILTNASREGARLGIVSSVPPIDLAAVNAKIDSYLIAAGINPADVSRTPPPTLTGGTGSAVIVTLTLPYTPITSFIAPISLVARTEMRHE